MTRFIFITGGVTSSLGKGLASASLASLLQARGFKIHLKKELTFIPPRIYFAEGEYKLR